MDKKFENALYMSGLTAQGCWDELDDYAKQAIIKFGECVVKETLQVAYAGLEFGPSMEAAVERYFEMEL